MPIQPLTSAACRLMSSIRGLGADTRGVAAIEFAMIVPVMAMLFMGTVEMSQAITVDRRVTQVASSTADLVSRSSAVSDADLAGVMNIISYLVSPYDTAPLKVTVLNIYSQPTVATDTRVCWSYSYNGGTGTYAAGAAYTLPTGMLAANSSVVVAEVKYNYAPLIFSYFITTAFTMNEKFYLKPRLSASVQYNSTKCI